MARGKHETQALRARYEALLAVVDDLTEKNAELKVRTRRVEADAAATPGLRQRVAGLERMILNDEFPKLNALRAEMEATISERDALLHWCGKQLSLLCRDMLKGAGLDDRVLPLTVLKDRESGLMRSQYGFSLPESNRAYRRAFAQQQTQGDRNLLNDQDKPDLKRVFS